MSKPWVEQIKHGRCFKAPSYAVFYRYRTTDRFRMSQGITDFSGKKVTRCDSEECDGLVREGLYLTDIDGIRIYSHVCDRCGKGGRHE